MAASGPSPRWTTTAESLPSYRQQRPDGSYPSILINSLSVSKLLGWMDAGQLSNLSDYLADELQKLVRGGADFGIIAANTPHIIFDELQRRSPIPLISIVEATCAETQHAFRGLQFAPGSAPGWNSA